MTRFFAQLKDELRAEIGGLVLIAIAILGFLGLFGTAAGAVGAFMARVLTTLFGESAVLVPSLIGFVGVMAFIEGGRSIGTPRGVGVALLILLAAAFFHVLRIPAGLELANGRQGLGGGLIGGAFSWVLLRGFGVYGRLLILILLALVGLLLVTNVSLSRGAVAAKNFLVRWTGLLMAALRDFLLVARDDAEPESDPEPALDRPKMIHARVVEEEAEPPISPRRLPRAPSHSEAAAAAVTAPGREAAKPAQEQSRPAGSGPDLDGEPIQYQLPPLSLLNRVVKGSGRAWEKEIVQKTRLLEDTLTNFGVKAEVKAVSHGPAITRFEVQPAPGVKVSRIANLADDIALSLAAADVRIVAPIPGKAAVGIEVPNREITPVYLRGILESREFQEAPSKLTIALGQDIAGRPVVFDLERALHVLIAGATGSGKSVCINALICSLLFKARPDEVRLVLVDPKMVELTGYNGIPHLLAPVVTDPRRAAGSLRWLVREMENRYEKFAAAGVRDISRYNEWLNGRGEERIPFIVVVIDELADLMTVAPVDVEDAIQRLAQMARAAGIHLVVATQRPSVDVITGVIKANIPTRVAFAVSSQVDSRTILDGSGAEKLVGKGDMLFHPIGASKPVRVQGAFISEGELEALLAFIGDQAEPVYREDVLTAENGDDPSADEPDDDLFVAALRVVVESGQASVSMIQRRLRVGYTRAGRLIDMMEERGFVGPHQGSKPRDVHLTLEELREMFG